MKEKIEKLIDGFKVHDVCTVSKTFEFGTVFGVWEGFENIRTVKIVLRFKFGVGFWWSVHSDNFTCGSKNTILPSVGSLVYACLTVIEKKSVGDAKYQALKEILRENKMWQKL